VRRFPDTVTFQAPTEPVRSTTGAITYEYDNVADLTGLPARVIPVIEEETRPDMIVTEDLYQIIVQGDRAIESEMVALTTEGVFDVRRVARPTIGRPMTLATLVVAQRVAI
jgi:hypothetical protein